MDEQKLYFHDPNSGLWAMPKTGGDRQLVIPTKDSLLLDSSTIDDTHIYHVDSADPSSLLRTPKWGGPIESRWGAANRPIRAVTVDASNVY
jgi:hypothetical protein